MKIYDINKNDGFLSIVIRCQINFVSINYYVKTDDLMMFDLKKVVQREIHLTKFVRNV